MADLGLELSSSRGSSYQDLTEIESLPQLSPSRRIPRPPSYSDSFFFLSPNTIQVNLTASVNSIPLSTPIASETRVQPEPQPEPQPNRTITKLLSVGTHITLIGIFETVFYFQFISKSEDGGIQNTINQFLQGTLQQCASWPANTTALIADIVALAVNETAVAQAALAATQGRQQANGQLQLQAWMYVLVLSFTLLVAGLTARIRGHRINWREIVIDNIVLVVLLGAYEAFFFETIIYRYQSLTLPELEQSILQQLSTQCGI